VLLASRRRRVRREASWLLQLAALRDEAGQARLVIGARGHVFELSQHKQAVTENPTKYDVLAVQPLRLSRRDVSKASSTYSQSLTLAQVKKNWQPLLAGPELAMLRSPGPVCFRSKDSSSNLEP